MKKVFEYLRPAIITIVLFLIVYIILGITPFGNKTIFHYDMGLQYYPALTLMYDVIHGERDVFYNFNIGGGQNAYAALVSNGFYSPVNWLIAIGEREDIPTATSWIVILKFCLISISTYYVLKKIFPKLNEKWILLGALLNTFSSYSLLYYVNFQWIECWALFPLTMLGMKKILDGESGVLFTVSLTACLLISFYMAWLNLLIILFGGGLCLFLYTSKENRKKAAAKLFFNTLISLGISFISFYPAFTASMNSYRMENTNEFLETYNPIVFKGLHFLTSPILLYYTFMMLYNYKNDKRNVRILGGLLLITLIPFFIEPINKMWHTGSYSGLPFRFGFIIIFIMVCSMLHYIDVRKKEDDKKIEENKKNKGRIIVICLLIIYIVFNIYAVKESGDYQYILGEIEYENISCYENIMISTFIGITILGCIKQFKDEKYEFKIVGVLFLISSLFLMFLYIKNFDGFSLENKFENNSLFIVQDFYEEFYTEDTVYKVKDETFLLLNNYPYILKMNSIENWYHTIPERQVNTGKKLGYSYYKVLQEDIGGTLISDIILGVNNVFSDETKNEIVYKKIDSINNIGYYTYNFKALPLAKIYEDSIEINNFLEEDFKIKDVFKTQNDLYKVFFNKQENVINIVDDYVATNINNKEDKFIVNNESKIEFDISLSEVSNLYLYMYDSKDYITKVKVFDEQENKLYENMTKYPKDSNNGILDLGVFEKGNFIIEVDFILEESIEKGSFSNIELGVLNVEELMTTLENSHNYEQTVNFEKNTFNISVETEKENQKLFIPINYNEGWSAKLNGKVVDINIALGTYMSIPLEKGINEIEFLYFPPNFKIGIIVTIIAAFIYIVSVIICKVTKIENTKFIKIIYFIGTIAFMIFLVVFIFAIYIKPLF